MYKVFVAIALVCFIQTIQSVPVQEISPATREKLSQAIVEAQRAKHASGDQVNAVRNVVEDRIDAALKPIQKQLDDLKAEVKEAESSLKNIEACVDAVHAAAHNLDRDVVRDCRNTKETHEAGNKLGEMGYQIHRLHQAVQHCLPEADQDACVNKIIDDAKVQVSKLQKEVSEILKKANPDSQNECISEGSQQLKAQVDKIVKDWKACLEQHKPSA